MVAKTILDGRVAVAESDQDITPNGDVTPETIAEPESWGGDRAAPDRDELPPGTRVGRLTIRHRLGAGGMGIVYAARDPQLERQVALKFLRPKSRTASEQQKARARMLREARAMAQISHANVITVYDVGTFDDDVYVAMEMVEGQSLAQWLSAKQRSWSEVLDAYLAAGRGLAAAHAAGLIHRDFKPDNVLVSNDGAVKVTDFGLVTPGEDDPQEPSASPVSPDDLALTATNALMGTPLYMATEQFDAGPTSAATDQFNFCVALYESLTGVNPFVGEDPSARYHSIVSGEHQRVPQGRDVPDWLLPILRRGLAVDPAARHESMQALLHALQRDPVARRRRRLAVATAVLVAAGGGAVGYWALAGNAPPAAAMCKGAEARLTGVWDDSIKQSAAAAFHRSGAPFADTTWKNVGNRLDAYAAGWTAMNTEACERTRVYKDQSTAVLDLRMACLDERRTELQTLTGLFARADKTTVQRALRAAYALAPVSRCADVRALKFGFDEARGADRKSVTEVRTLVVRAEAMAGAGKYKAALRTSRDALTRANATKFRALEAEASHELGLALTHVGKLKEARAVLKKALWNAEASHHDPMAVLIWIARLHLAAQAGGTSPIADSFVDRASAALARYKNNPSFVARMSSAIGALRLEQGRFLNAYSHFSRALEVWRKLARAPNDPAIPHALNNVALAEVELGKYADAERHYRKALAQYEQRLGKDHPDTGKVLGNLGLLLVTTGRARQALPLYRHQLAIAEAQFGKDSLPAAAAHDNLGNALTRLGKLPEGLRELQTALRLEEKLAGKDHPDVASVLHAIAIVLRKAGKLDLALGANLRAVAIMKKAYGRLDGSWSHMVIGLAETRMLRKEYPRAIKLLTQVLPVEKKRRGKSSPEVRRVHLLLAICHEQLKQPADTIAEYEAALAIASPARKDETARMQFMLARALYERNASGDRPRARKLAQQAQRHFAAAGPKRFAASIERWLASH